MSSAAEKKLTDCYWFLQGKCVKGEQCEYRHNDAVLNNPLPCTKWAESKCTDAKCKFRHPSGVQAQKQTPCAYFARGGCMRGSSCQYSHSIEFTNAAEPVTKSTPQTAEIEEQMKKMMAAKKKQEEELKQLQLERQREEQRLERLRNETQGHLKRRQPDEPNNRNQGDAQRRRSDNRFDNRNDSNSNRRDNRDEARGERQVYVPKNRDNKDAQPRQAQDKPNARAPIRSAPAKSASKSGSPAGKPNFGVKSLDELKAEQKPAPTETAPPASTSKSIDSTTQARFDEIKQRNLKKFATEPEKAAPAASPAKSASPAPIRKIPSTTANQPKPELSLKDNNLSFSADDLLDDLDTTESSTLQDGDDVDFDALMETS